MKVHTGKGFELEPPSTYIHMMEEAEATISELLTGYPKASKMWNLLNDPEVNADWDMSNRGLR
jgi:hypothetical protein